MAHTLLKVNRKKIIACVAVFTFIIFAVFFNSIKVHAASTDNMSGWAWSSNIGWISFNNQNGGSGCSTVLAPASVTGGWDGWISLKGTASDGSPYGVTLTNNAFTGYAWGGPVVGWIQFNPAFGGVKLMTVSCSATPASAK